MISRWSDLVTVGVGLSRGVTMAGRVLIVEDQALVRELLSVALTQAGHLVRTADCGAAALESARAEPPDLVVLDLGLPDLDGVEVCRRLRAASEDCYVLMLTGRTDEVDVLVGLAVGADGYLTKPVSPRELVARVGAMLRRPRVPDAGPAAQVCRVGELEVDLDAREVRVAARELRLTRIEFDLLATLAGRPGRVFQRETLLREVWRTDWEGSLRLVEVHVSNLRRKLAAAGLDRPEIRTVRGVGYQLVA
jgi:DNA-binding response OmpR family regulator